MKTAEQHRRSANKNKYKMLNPFDAIMKAIMDKKITILFADLKFLFIFLPSTTIKLEIALTNVSMVLTANYIPKIITTMYNKSVLSFNNIEKKARSGFKLVSTETAMIPVIPIKKTMGIIIKKDSFKLLFKTS